MSSLETLSLSWMDHAWGFLLVFSVAIMLVVLLRRLCRWAFGAARAFQLWVLVPLTLIAAALPHPSVVVASPLPPVVLRIVTTPGSLSTQVAGVSGVDLRSSLALLWWAGTVLTLGLAWLAQYRYQRRLQGAVRIDTPDASWPIWISNRSDVGPALVGAWRARIVLPADFEARYAPAEQALIVAHEVMHARRGDGWLSLFAHLFAAAFWFNPLAWVALRMFRHDQELACDAAVMREHGKHRQRYAKAMLKTQATAIALPVGCPWSPRHPVTERIATLKLRLPGRLRRIAGLVAIAALVLGSSAAVYASRPSASMHKAQPEAINEAFALFGGAKTAVAFYWSDHAFVLPATNEEAELPDGKLMSGKYVREIDIHDGKITASLRASAGGGRLVLVPAPDRTRKRLGWRCNSPDIPKIATLADGCVFQPVNAETFSHPRDDRYTLRLALSVDGLPVHLRSTGCLEPGQYYTLTEGTDHRRPPWNGRLTVVPVKGGRLQVNADLSGGSLAKRVTPRIRMQPGQVGEIQVGDIVSGKDGKSQDHTLKLKVTAWNGCITPPASSTHEDAPLEFSTHSARAAAEAIAEQSGLEIVNPDALDDTRPVAGNFEQVSAAPAFQLIGNLVGMKPVMDGKQVRFEPR